MTCSLTIEVQAPGRITAKRIYTDGISPLTFDRATGIQLGYAKLYKHRVTAIDGKSL